LCLTPIWSLRSAKGVHDEARGSRPDLEFRFPARGGGRARVLAAAYLGWRAEQLIPVQVALTRQAQADMSTISVFIDMFCQYVDRFDRLQEYVDR
jgi:hypothetical protein